MAASSSSSSNSGSYITARPTAIAQGPVNIDHPQLRDLVECPHEQGVVAYLKETEIVEQNLNLPNAPIRTLADLGFTPSSLTTLALGPNDEHTLVAAGGSWNAELHLSYHRPDGTAPVWQYDCRLNGTLNNSVLLTRSNSSSCEPRVGVTNNDQTFRMYDCAVRRQPLAWRGIVHEDEDFDDGEDNGRLECVGSLKLDTCANYAALSPSGRMLLTVGDSPNAYLHYIHGSSRLTFRPIATIPLPLPTNTPPLYPTSRPSTFTASFATAWSKDGSKYAVGSQEGVVTVWDIRSTKPLKVFQVDKMRGMGPGGLGAAAGWISWDPSDWFMQNAPAWSVRNLKFGGDENGVNETLAFTEHTSLVHMVDAKTLEREQIVQVPARMQEPEPPSPPLLPASGPLHSPLALIQLNLPPIHFSTTTDSYLYPETPTSPSTEVTGTSGAVESEAMDEDGDEDEDRERGNTPLTAPQPSTLPNVSQLLSRHRVRRRPIPPRLPNTTIANGFVYPPPTSLHARLPEFEYRDNLDIGGLCFDPSGKWMYVGTTEGVVEWGVIPRGGGGKGIHGQGQ